MSPSTSMPPPPTPFAHRRSRLHPDNSRCPPSPPHSPESPCALRKMSLSKGATFHVPSAPPVEDDPVLSIRHLGRRSPTCPSSSLLSLITDKKDVAARSIIDFEQTFSGARGNRSSTHRRTSDHLDQQLGRYRHTNTPIDEGLGSSTSAASEKGLARSFERALDLVSDSGYGSSIKTASVKEPTRENLPRTSEDDGLVAQDLVEDHSVAEPRRTRQRGNHPSNISSRSAVTQSISPQVTLPASRQPHLSTFARRQLAKNIIEPILQEDRFEIFHPLVSSLGSRSNKNIRCLRDLEQSLIFQPLVSSATESDPNTDAYFDSLLTQTLAASQHLYRTFGEFSVQLVLNTYQHLSESEQRRVSDRPYDNGYFLDLVQQVGQLAAQIGRARQAKISREEGEKSDEDEMTYSSEDEVTLEGGLSANGEVAELVRWKDGRGISLRTNQPYQPTVGLKRQHTDEAFDDEVARSMARRKKGEIPKIIERKCSDPGCDKVFTRQCDLAKHEKTHSRPFKCPEPTCKYHIEGLPTEKEKDRHVNDKHDPNPTFYNCQFCPFKTKRESNCKQHMEKKHNWTYERVKGSGKVVRTPGQTPQTPTMEYSPSPAPSNQYDDVSSISGSIAGSGPFSPSDGHMTNFNGMPSPAAYGVAGAALFPRSPNLRTQSSFGYDPMVPSSMYANPAYTRQYAPPVNTNPMVPHYGGSPITPAYSNITYDQSPSLDRMNINVDYSPSHVRSYTGLPTPDSRFLQAHSRNPSLSYESPMDLEQFEPEAFYTTNPGMTTHGMVNDSYITHSQQPPMEDFLLLGNDGAFTGPSTSTHSHLFPDMPAGNYINYEDETLPDIDRFVDFDRMDS